MGRPRGHSVVASSPSSSLRPASTLSLDSTASSLRAPLGSSPVSGSLQKISAIALLRSEVRPGRAFEKPAERAACVAFLLLQTRDRQRERRRKESRGARPPAVAIVTLLASITIVEPPPPPPSLTPGEGARRDSSEDRFGRREERGRERERG